MLREEMRIGLDSSTFWTDSQITLPCINNTDKRFNVFVANRLSAIQDSTTAKQWHWCPTNLNPAEDATRGMKPTELEKRWITGPAFLQNKRSITPRYQPMSIILTSSNNLHFKRRMLSLKLINSLNVISVSIDSHELQDCYDVSSHFEATRETNKDLIYKKSNQQGYASLGMCKG